MPVESEKGEDGARLEWRWRRDCPRFNGLQAEYKGWKGQVEDWLAVCGDDVKYPGIEIRMSLKGKALAVTEGIDRDELKKSVGEKAISKKLDEAYLKDTLMDNYSKMKRYFKIERESGETMRDFIIRYEKMELECRRAIGKNMFEGEAKGFHVLEQASITDNQKQMVLSACGNGKLEYGTVSQIMKRIFEGLGNKEEDGKGKESEWLESEGYSNLWRGRENYRSRGRGNRSRGRGGRNPLNKQGKVSVCVICNSEWHWARECPQNIINKKKEENRTMTNQEKEKDEERVYVGEISKVDEESWGEVDAILDTGCKSTVCGEL